MRLQAYNDNGTMKFRQVSGSQAIDSLPVGTIIGYEGTVIPNGYLLCDGSTFDTAKYPELFALLGSDRLPELFDHNKRDTAYTNIRSEVGSTAQTAYEMPYDGDITLIGSSWSQNYCSVVILKADGTTIDWTSSFAGSYDAATTSGGTAIFLNKGDKFYASGNNSSRTVSIQARFYKQHLLIKAATIGISDVGINTIKGALTYSTEETLTGGTWIDGKPIYRRSIEFKSSYPSLADITNVDNLVGRGGYIATTAGTPYNELPFPWLWGNEGSQLYLHNGALTWQVSGITLSGTKNSCVWIEYTKTTD